MSNTIYTAHYDRQIDRSNYLAPVVHTTNVIEIGKEEKEL